MSELKIKQVLSQKFFQKDALKTINYKYNAITDSINFNSLNNKISTNNINKFFMPKFSSNKSEFSHNNNINKESSLGDYIFETNTYHEVFETNSYIPEAVIDKIKNTDNEAPIVLHAPTGSGKTHMISSLTNKDETVLFICPNIALLENAKAEFEAKGLSVGVFHGQTKAFNAFYTKNKKILSTKNIIVATYEQLVYTLKPMVEKGVFSYVIADESQSIYEESYRHAFIEVLRQLNATSMYAKVVLLSATMYHSVAKVNNWNSITVKQTDKSKLYLPNLNMVNMAKKDKVKYVVDKVKEARSNDKKIVVYQNDKDSLNEIHEALRSEGFRGIVATSDTKTTKVFRRVLKTHSLEEFDYLLGTKIIESGVSILDTNIDEIIYLYPNDFSAQNVMQLGARIRANRNINLTVVHNQSDLKEKCKSAGIINKHRIFDENKKIYDCIASVSSYTQYNMISQLLGNSGTKNFTLEQIETMLKSPVLINHLTFISVHEYSKKKFNLAKNINELKKLGCKIMHDSVDLKCCEGRTMDKETLKLGRQYVEDYLLGKISNDEFYDFVLAMPIEEQKVIKAKKEDYCKELERLGIVVEADRERIAQIYKLGVKTPALLRTIGYPMFYHMDDYKAVLFNLIQENNDYAVGKTINQSKLKGMLNDFMRMIKRAGKHNNRPIYDLAHIGLKTSMNTLKRTILNMFFKVNSKVEKQNGRPVRVVTLTLRDFFENN